MDKIRPEQTLTERWEITYTRAPWPSRSEIPITARLSWPHHVIYGVSGRGATIEEARLDLVLHLAAAIADCDVEGSNPPLQSVRMLLNAARRGIRFRLKQKVEENGERLRAVS